MNDNGPRDENIPTLPERDVQAQTDAADWYTRAVNGIDVGSHATPAPPANTNRPTYLRPIANEDANRTGAVRQMIEQQLRARGIDPNAPLYDLPLRREPGQKDEPLQEMNAPMPLMQPGEGVPTSAAQPRVQTVADKQQGRMMRVEPIEREYNPFESPAGPAIPDAPPQTYYDRQLEAEALAVPQNYRPGVPQPDADGMFAPPDFYAPLPDDPSLDTSMATAKKILDNPQNQADAQSRKVRQRLGAIFDPTFRVEREWLMRQLGYPVNGEVNGVKVPPPNELVHTPTMRPDRGGEPPLVNGQAMTVPGYNPGSNQMPVVPRGEDPRVLMEQLMQGHRGNRAGIQSVY